jgi:hypothetical protein
MTTAADDPQQGQPPRPPADDPYAGQDVIVARAGRYYRNARYLMVLLCLGLACWFAYDGWVGWPRENAQALQKGAEKLPRSEFDILLQRLLAGALPFVGLGILIRALHHSRGEYRLDGNTLHVPGHPPVPLDSIRQIDKSKWERKGVARLDYEPPGTTETRRLTLDDFVYDQTATDAILARIEAILVPPEAEPAHAATGGEPAQAAEADAHTDAAADRS